MATPPRPSTKDYTPVPVEEGIADGLDVPQQELDADDDELYSTSAPLLSNRSRGNEPATVEGLCWYHKIGSWRPFRQSRHCDSWNPPRKPQTWRQITIYALLSFLALAVIAFATATGVLAHKTRSYNRGYPYRPVQDWRMSHVPFKNIYKSSNGNLNFPALYPPIQPSQSACRTAWASLSSIPCHEKIWNRSWDNGKHTSIFDPAVGVYAKAICDARCTTAITRAQQIISSQCTEEDKFDTSDYIGTFSADPGLEDGPIGALNTISKRVSHTCRQQPVSPNRWNSWNPAPYCSLVMWDDWFIVDGMNAGNLEGLDMFETRTRTPRTENSRYDWHSVQDTCDSIPENYVQRFSGLRRFGPTVNSTTCGWCTMDWFERKLLSWKQDEIKDPKTGKNIGLVEYLKKIKHAGERCDADAWDRTWARAIRRYKLSGELPDGWEEGKGNEKEKGLWSQDW